MPETSDPLDPDSVGQALAAGPRSCCRTRSGRESLSHRSKDAEIDRPLRAQRQLRRMQFRRRAGAPRQRGLPSLLAFALLKRGYGFLEAALTRRIFVGWLAVFGCALLTSALAAPTSEQMNFHRFAPRDGLPSAVVYCAMQDSRGFLWFGTADGVARFDGHSFRVFRPDPADPESLANGAVLGIQEDDAGNLWMATEGGLDLWHRDTERFSHFRRGSGGPGTLSDDTTQCLWRDPDGILWIGTRGRGLNRFDPKTGQFSRVTLAGGLSDIWITCLYRDRRGTLWIGTGSRGLHRLSEKGAVAYTHIPDNPQSLSSDHVAAVAEDRWGHLWIGTEGGLCRLDPQTERLERVPLNDDPGAPHPTQSVTALLVDRDGRICFGTDGGGFTVYDPARGRFLTHRHSRYASNSLAADAVRTVFEAPNGDLWIGHFPNGVSHFDRSTAAFQVFSSAPGDPNTMSDDQVLSFLEDPAGDLWVGTDNGGLNRWSAASGQWTSYKHSPNDPTSLSAKAALCLCRDRRGTLWVGTWGGGLNRFVPETGTFRAYRPRADDPHALSDSHVWRVLEDRDGALWIATIGGGLNRFVPEKEEFTAFRHAPTQPRSLNDDIVSSLLLTRDGTLWAGTPHGLARFDRATQTWDRFDGHRGECATLTGFWIFDLYEDRDGTIWATSEGGGLHHLDPRTGHNENFRTAAGLPSDVLRGIVADDAGILWIGSNRGLVRFDPATRHIRVFDEGNGLPGSQFNPHARYRLPSGELLFGTTQGFVRFDPRKLDQHAPPPPVVLTQFEVFNTTVRPGAADGILPRSITETHELALSARYSVIQFRFAALSFGSRAHIRYRIKLEGFDRDWRVIEGEPRATFTNLDPGNYRLRVLAEGDGETSADGVSLALTIVPLWWQSWWFRGTAALGILAAAATVGWSISNQRMREAQHARELAVEHERAEERARAAADLRAANQELEARVADRTAQLVSAMKELEAFSYSVSHDLRSPLRSMDGFSRILLDDYGPKLDEEGRDSLRRVRAATQRMGRLIDDLLLLSRVSRDDLVRAPVDLTALAIEIGNELRREHPAQQIELSIAPGLVAHGDARLLRIALSNLLGNACKFSSKRPVSHIEFGTVERDGVDTFYVRDNGAGFDPNYADRMFEAFRRFHTPSEFPGSGIGLATVQRIIRRHGGTIYAESKPDAGATFFFTLPEQRGSRGNRSVPPGEHRDGDPRPTNGGIGKGE